MDAHKTCKKDLRVVFYGFRKTTYPNLGVGYLVANLRKHGFHHDYQFLEAAEDLDKAVKDIGQLKPDIVGLTACSVDFNMVKELSKRLKKAFNPLILLGGAHISSVPYTLPPEIDVGFVGESEGTIVDVFRLLESGDCDSENLGKTKGVVFFDERGELHINERRPYEKNLDAFDHPARDIFSKDYWKSESTSLLTSRGCPFHCAFCQVSTEWRVCRYHSAEYVVAEIKELVENCGLHTFGVVDDLFIVNKTRLVEIREELARAGLLGKVRFAVNGRANLITEELVELLKSIGTSEIALGLESMSPRILPMLKERVTVEDNMRAVDIIYNCGLKAGGLYMIGTPGESLEDMAMTYNYIKDNRHKLGGLQFCVTTPLPNTRLWDMCVERGKIDPDISKYDWDKLVITAENTRVNNYVGDVDEDTFATVIRKFRRLANQQASMADSNNDLLYDHNNSEIDASKPMQEVEYRGLTVVERDGNKYLRLDRKGHVELVGVFSRLTVSYRTIDTTPAENVAATIEVAGTKHELTNTHGRQNEETFVLGNGTHKRRVERILIESAAESVEILFSKISVDYLGVTENYIVPGENELEQVKAGMYPVEDWPGGKVFWTNGCLEGYIRPKGGEKELSLEFLSGRKADTRDKYRVEVQVIEESSGREICTQKSEVAQSSWIRIDAGMPPRTVDKPVKVIVRTDTFSPAELKMSVDSRILGIAIKRVAIA
jgi:anaerobic magnesium-protoporphyrin IX monomethyl ester cyclase